MKKVFLCSMLGIVMAVAMSMFVWANDPSAELPKIPFGYDSYKMWDKWPQQRLGVRAYMRSTYSRTGGNRSADASHYLFGNEETYNVSLDVKGTGSLYFFRTNHWHGSPWHFVTDGRDNIVQETGTFDPDTAKATYRDRPGDIKFHPSDQFPPPLALNWGTTKGADLIWVPMPFKETFRIAYSRTRYGTGYYIYHLVSDPARLTREVKPWNLSQMPDPEVVQFLASAGTDIAPKNIETMKKSVKLDKSSVSLGEIKSASVVRALKLTLPKSKAIDFERMRLRITWDDRKAPSVDAPICLFFGAGTLYNRDNREFLVKALPVNIRFDNTKDVVELACYFPMPFFKSAKFELTDIVPDAASPVEVQYEIRYEPFKGRIQDSSYFHATYKDMPTPTPGVDNTLLDTQGIEGEQVWSGNFVGTSFIFSHNAYLGTLEGDPRFFFDDARTPQAYGTGTEEWGGGGDYWGGENMTVPLAGHPCGSRNKELAKDPKDLIQSAYRFLLADLMPFGRRAVINLEHGGENESNEHYESVTFWYGLPAPSLVKTDVLDVGILESERAHQYVSPDASGVYSLVSRFDSWGPDTINPRTNVERYPHMKDFLGKEVIPTHEEKGRTTKGTSEFAVAVDPKNVGVMLRRTLDYSYPNQTAEVFVADGNATGDAVEWKKVGIWYLAGSNTCYFSDPRPELGLRTPEVITSNRQFRDDEFLIPSSLTAGKSKLRVRVQFVKNDQQLLPGIPYPKESAWSEIRYDVFSYVVPEHTP